MWFSNGEAMLDNKVIDNVRGTFSDHDYIMTTAQLNFYKIYYAGIQTLLNEGLIKKIKRGYYHWVENYAEQPTVIGQSSQREINIYYAIPVF